MKKDLLAIATASLPLILSSCGGESHVTRPVTVVDTESAAITTLDQAPLTPYPPATANTAPPSDSTTFDSEAPHATSSDVPIPNPLGGTGPTIPPSGAPTPLDDRQIAGMARDINRAELDQAVLAASRASSPRVKAHAQRVARMRLEFGQRMTSLTNAEHIAPIESQRSLDYSVQARDVWNALEVQSGTDFDRAFMEAQVRSHQTALDLLDRSLAPSATNGKLSTMLREERDMILDDLSDANEVLSTLTTTK